MLSALPSLLAPVLIVVVFAFLSLRLAFFSGRGIEGRYLFVSGGILLLLAAIWQSIKASPGYSDWFVVTAYPLIDLFQFLVAAAGLLMAVIGLALYADHWQSRREEMDIREGKLSILENLQHDARQPYHLLELLEIALREILVQFPMASGAIFLVNRSRRQFVLTTSSGLNKEEVAHLEYYPIQRNVVSQAVELGDPMLLTKFDFYDRAGQPIASRFRSSLVLPLVSGMEKIGGLLLFSEEASFFSRTDIRYLAPVAQWLTELIKSVRLSRELNQTRTGLEKKTEAAADLLARVSATSRALASSDAVAAFCRSLVGIAASHSAHLCGIRRGELRVYGGSRPLFDLTENYRAALVETIGRGKPLIINQEAQGEGERSSVVLSTLVYPLPSGEERDALLLLRNDRPFTIGDEHLKQLDVFAGLAARVLAEEEHHRFDLTRRKGFECITELLKADETLKAFDEAPGFLPDQLVQGLPKGAAALAFALGDGSLRLVYRNGAWKDGEASDLEIELGEGGLGRAAADRVESFVSGRTAVQRDIESYHDVNRSAFHRLFGEKGAPGFLAYCPVRVSGDLAGMLMIGVADLGESERGEWQRLITLAAGLYSLRLTMLELALREIPEAPASVSGTPTGPAANQLNNHLSAIVGTAELLAREAGPGTRMEKLLKQVVESAESAADLVRSGSLTAPTAPGPENQHREDLNQVIRTVLSHNHVSGNLFMVGQRAREIRLRLGDIGPVRLSSRQMEELFQSVLNRFSLLAEEEDVITVATYRTSDYIYLDISRHHPSFPAVDRVSDFGRYSPVEKAFENRPSDIYLRHVTDRQSFYAVDSDGPIPAYLSFKFPVGRLPGGQTGAPEPSGLKVLAVDDQQVILDLISAMGQSLGYEVRTAPTGEAGLDLVRREAFDLILTDLALPGLSGLEVARQAREIRPGVPVILVTGWASNLDQAELERAGVAEVLYKPFRIEQLTESVRRVLGQAARS
jgi:CheY-like chemotaxis protein